MSRKNTIVRLAVVTAVSVLGTAALATDRDDHGQERGGAVVRCSLVGVNPASTRKSSAMPPPPNPLVSSRRRIIRGTCGPIAVLDGPIMRPRRAGRSTGIGKPGGSDVESWLRLALAAITAALVSALAATDASALFGSGRISTRPVRSSCRP